RFRAISNLEISQLISFLTGSLGDFLDRHYESDKIKTLFLANNVYGKHGGPFQPGTAIGLLFHLLSGGEHELQGVYGHVMGGAGNQDGWPMREGEYGAGGGTAVHRNSGKRHSLGANLLHSGFVA